MMTDEQQTEIERLRAENADMLAVVRAAEAMFQHLQEFNIPYPPGHMNLAEALAKLEADR